jgi:hypothetical protein
MPGAPAAERYGACDHQCGCNHDGVAVVDPATHRQPKLDEGHIAYQLDDHNRVDSTSKTQTFSELRAGDHRIRVSLMSNDNHQMGKEQVLKIHVP